MEPSRLRIASGCSYADYRRVQPNPLGEGALAHSHPIAHRRNFLRQPSG